MDNNYSNDTHDWVGNINISIFWDVVLCEYENRGKNSGDFPQWVGERIVERRLKRQQLWSSGFMTIRWTRMSKFKVFMLRVNATSQRPSRPGGRDIQMSTHIFPGMRASPEHSDHSCGPCPEQYGTHRRYAVSTDWVMNTWRQKLRGENLIQEKWLRITWKIYTYHLLKLSIMKHSEI